MTLEKETVCSVQIPEIVAILGKYYEISLEEAMQRFYESNTVISLADAETGLYGQSPLFVAGLYITEKDGNIDLQRMK